MKYLILTNHSYMLWQFRRELVQRLLEDGEVVISTPFVGHEHDFEKMGCHCIETQLDRRSINPAKDLRLYRFYTDLLKKEKPDLVITYSIKPNIYGGYACQRLGIPYFVNVQGLGTAFQKKGMALVASQLYRTALLDAKTVFFENKENAKSFYKKRIVKRGQVVVLPGAGVNLDYFSYQPYPDETDGIHFLFLGRIMKEKGVDELFAAFKSLKEEYQDRVTLDLVGFFEDEYKDTVEELVKNGTVIFHGFQEDPRPYYAAAHCVVLPSYHEGMSNVLLEAAATGRALITSDIPGCREAVEDGVSGYLCKVKDAKKLREAMDKFYLLKKEQRESMGKQGRVLTYGHFSRSIVIEKTVRQLRKACEYV